MSQTQISAGQSLLDVSLQELGGLNALFDLADAAGLGITDALTPGQTLDVPESAAALPELAAYFASRSQRLNTSDRLVPAAIAPAQGHDFDYRDLLSTDFY